MIIITFLRALGARLAKMAAIPGEREALDAHLQHSANVHDAESRLRAWDERRRSGHTGWM
jgi:hypothetical protein